MGSGGGAADRKGNTLGDLPPLTQGICFPESLAINRLNNAADITANRRGYSNPTQSLAGGDLVAISAGC
jgi:hypothetical protein